MSFTEILKSGADTCPFCHQKAGILSREHPLCRRAHQAGWNEMVQLATQAAGSRDFDESHLRLTLSAVAKISYGNEDKAQYQPANGGSRLRGANPEEIVNRLLEM